MFVNFFSTSFFVALYTSALSKYVTNNYCCLSCGEKHVMCQYPDPNQIGARCKEYKKVNLDPEKVIGLYNRMKSVKGIYAGATDIMKMVLEKDNKKFYYNEFQKWDFELQEMAQTWANQCPNSTDQCRDTARSNVNQIVDSIINEQFVSPTWESVFLKWYIQDIPHDKILKYSNGAYSPLSQLIWGKTQRVGCAASSHLIDTGRLVTMVCNYAPPGNIEGEPIFDTHGGMCTKCPPGSGCTDQENVNLCVPTSSPGSKPNRILLIFLTALKVF